MQGPTGHPNADCTHTHAQDALRLDDIRLASMQNNLYIGFIVDRFERAHAWILRGDVRAFFGLSLVPKLHAPRNTNDYAQDDFVKFGRKLADGTAK